MEQRDERFPFSDDARFQASIEEWLPNFEKEKFAYLTKNVRRSSAAATPENIMALKNMVENYNQIENYNQMTWKYRANSGDQIWHS